MHQGRCKSGRIDLVVSPAFRPDEDACVKLPSSWRRERLDRDVAGLAASRPPDGRTELLGQGECRLSHS